MKFHSLIAAALLLLAFDSDAALLGGEAHAAAPQASPALQEDQVFVYRNGELVLDIRDSAGAGILRTGLAYFFRDEHIATANELPAAPSEALTVQAQPAPADAQPVGTQLPEPFSLGLLGAGIAMLGWTRRQGSWTVWLKGRPGRWELFPWPALTWLD